MITMAMKSFGLNPDDIKKQVQDAHDNFQAVCKHFDERLNAIEKTQQMILEKLNVNENPVFSAQAQSNVAIGFTGDAARAASNNDAESATVKMDAQEPV